MRYRQCIKKTMGDILTDCNKKKAPIFPTYEFVDTVEERTIGLQFVPVQAPNKSVRTLNVKKLAEKFEEFGFEALDIHGEENGTVLVLRKIEAQDFIRTKKSKR